MDLNQIGTFIRVVDNGSFTAAAGVMGLPKSSVSRGVAQLEESLGVRLLQRTTRKLNLTEAGRRYYQQVRRALGDIEQASSAAADMGTEPRGLVRLTAPGDFSGGQLSSALADFLLRYPRIQIDLWITQRWVNLVEEGFDLAIRAGQLRDSSLVARKLAASELALFAAPAYLERRGRPRRVADLGKHDCLLHRSGRGLMPWRLTGPRGAETVAVKGPVTADDFTVILRLAIKGLGIALLPEVACDQEVSSGALVRLLPAYALRGGAVQIVSPPLRYVPARVALLRDHLIRELSPVFQRAGAAR
jgi:DNA-binding transcriptional LysR family regulator